MRVVAAGLGNPWEITWGPDGYLWVTERSAFRVTRIHPADGSKHVALTIEDAYQSVDQDGLLGLALHPDLLTRPRAAITSTWPTRTTSTLDLASPATCECAATPTTDRRRR